MNIEQCEGFHKTTQEVLSSIDFCEPTLQIALFFVILNPLFWNTCSRLEFYTHIFTKLAGSRRIACYIHAATIFALGMVRSYFFEQAIRKQVISGVLDSELIQIVGIILIVFGQVLVFSSMYQLGITGTYNGDYFGILMKGRVYDFPFNIFDNPMYRGSTLTFLGVSLLEGKAAGLFVTLIVHLMYEIAVKFEEPFTMKIYEAPKED